MDRPAITITESLFESTTVQLDDTAFTNCIFTRCRLVYSGGRPPNMVGCSINECNWLFEGPAESTRSFMAAMAADGDSGTQFVLNILLGLSPETLRRFSDPNLFEMIGDLDRVDG